MIRICCTDQREKHCYLPAQRRGRGWFIPGQFAAGVVRAVQQRNGTGVEVHGVLEDLLLRVRLLATLLLQWLVGRHGSLNGRQFRLDKKISYQDPGSRFVMQKSAPDPYGEIRSRIRFLDIYGK